MPVIGLNDLAAIGFLIFLEGVLSIDNALVLALIVRTLPVEQQKRALTYGIAGAIAFRVVAISMATFLMRWWWVKFLGGGYLLYLSLHYFWTKNKGEEDQKGPKRKARSFWGTVIVVELTDIAFAIDSILTAVALSNKLWVVISGGVIGLVLMRFAASVFIRLLERFPRFEPTAYLLVFLIGVKLLIDGFHFPHVDFHDTKNPAFWIFWGSMALSLLFGFTNNRKKTDQQRSAS